MRTVYADDVISKLQQLLQLDAGHDDHCKILFLQTGIFLIEFSLKLAVPKETTPNSVYNSGEGGS